MTFWPDCFFSSGNVILFNLYAVLISKKYCFGHPTKCMHTRLCAYIRMWVRTCIILYTYIHSYGRTYIHVYVHTYMHAYIHTYNHTYIRTHTYMCVWVFWLIIHVYVCSTHYICSYIFAFLFSKDHNNGLNKYLIFKQHVWLYINNWGHWYDIYLSCWEPTQDLKKREWLFYLTFLTQTALYCKTISGYEDRFTNILKYH